MSFSFYRRTAFKAFEATRYTVPRSVKTRTEKDSLGNVEVPIDALWGAQTQRAVNIYQISGRPMRPSFIRALARVKLACAQVNSEIGSVDHPIAEAIGHAAQEVISGKHLEHFPIDVYQTGSGTATNMNMNEVLAARATALLAGQTKVHPNDHVNHGQSSNDVIPTTIHVAGAIEMADLLIPNLKSLAEALDAKAAAWANVIKSGRTHLMDATPMTLGQEVSGWAAQVHAAVHRVELAITALLDLALGGTAVGTGINTRADFAPRVIRVLATATRIPFHEASNHFEAQGSRDGAVDAHGRLETVAVSLFKVANDVRLLGSGPRAGLGELVLPSLAPGSSIMPGKVNPVMCEVVTQVAARVVGNGAAVRMGGASGHLQLNTFMPLIADALLESVDLLAAAAAAFETHLVDGLAPNVERCVETVERNLSLGTALAPVVGYDESAAIAKAAWATGRSVREVASERRSLPPAELARVLDPFAMTRPDPAPTRGAAGKRPDGGE